MLLYAREQAGEDYSGQFGSFYWSFLRSLLGFSSDICNAVQYVLAAKPH